MKKIFFISIFCGCMAFWSCDKDEQLNGSIEGTVTDFGTGQALAGVAVEMTGGGGSETGSDGRFHFADVEAGAYTLTFSKGGYPTVTREVNVPAGQTVSCDVALATDPDFEIVNGVLTAYYGRGGAVTIPEGVTGIGASVFQGNKAITSVVISEGIASIGNQAFKECENLTSLTLPNSLASIGDESFRQCSNLSSIAIPDGVTSIGDAAFFGCYSKMTSVTLGKNVKNLSIWAFTTCLSLVAFTVSAENEHYVTENGVLFNKSKTTLAICPGGKAGSYTIPSTVTAIGDDAFNGCYKLTAVTIPNSVTGIGVRAFQYCIKLTSINIPNNVVTIGEDAFRLCENLTSVNMGNGVVTLGNNAFRDCEKLVTVTLSNSLTSIGDYTFQNCSELTSITIPGSVTGIGLDAFSACGKLTSVVIPNSVTTISKLAFVDCIRLASVHIGKGVADIGEGAFGNTSLTSVTIDAENSAYLSDDNVVFNKSKSVLVFCPSSRSGSYNIPDGVTAIGSMAFAACLKLTSVSIPNSVTSINNAAFALSNKLTSVTVAWASPPSIPNNTFQDVPIATAVTLRVPTGARAAYLAADIWKNFKIIVEY
jgi:hypothetical protein